MEKHNQLDAPIGSSSAGSETVTVVDPRHPLHERTLLLLHIKNKQQLIPCCLVQLAEGVERLVPISVTNLATTPPHVFPLPVDLSSLENLTAAFARIQGQLDREQADETDTNAKEPDSVDPRFI